ncbi:MAG: restriction endonuclease subunit S [Magnetococcus sp. THC-1_WYH]
MSGNKKRPLVPQLRFGEFREAGEWEKSQLSKYVDSLDAGVSVVSGDRPAGSNEVGILKTSAVTDGVFSSQENKVVLDKGELQRVKEPVSENSIIISRMNTPALVGANAYVANSLENIFLPDRLWAAKPKRNTSMRFIAFVLGSEKGRAALSKLATGTSGSMKNITKPDVLALEIAAPSFAEQQKIADCLSSLDERIAAEANKLDTLKAHKKGLMQQLFPADGKTVPRLRFGKYREKGKWKERKLGSIGTFTGGGTPSKDKENYWVGKNPWISSSDISEDNIQDIRISRFISDEAIKETTTRLVPENSILIVSRVGVGKIAITRMSICTSQDFTNFTPDHDNLVFLAYCIKSLKNTFLAFNQGMAIKGFTKDDASNLRIPLPSLEEQQKIADCLSSLDELITAQAQKIELLKRHKKGLMQQLFPTQDEESA